LFPRLMGGEKLGTHSRHPVGPRGAQPTLGTSASFHLIGVGPSVVLLRCGRSVAKMAAIFSKESGSKKEKEGNGKNKTKRQTGRGPMVGGRRGTVGLFTIHTIPRKGAWPWCQLLCGYSARPAAPKPTGGWGGGPSPQKTKKQGRGAGRPADPRRPRLGR